jgi:hypothetical protein
MKTSVKWVAELAHVREVSILGTADLSFWKDRLYRQNLLPAERDGQAQIMIVAAESKYMGIRFQELSFSVLVSAGTRGLAKRRLLVVCLQLEPFFFIL